mgnify:CR=1 FL=1
MLGLCIIPRGLPCVGVLWGLGSPHVAKVFVFPEKAVHTRARPTVARFSRESGAIWPTVPPSSRLSCPGFSPIDQALSVLQFPIDQL